MYIDLGFRFHRCNRRLAPLLAVHLVLLAGTLGATLLRTDAAQAAPKHTDKREIEARQAFAAGQYQDALDLYAQLYADKVHPTYLRNIGRCYQNMRQPEKAINAFHDYLRQAKDLTPAERNEVDGYISEMEALRKEQAAATTTAATTPTPPTVPLVPPVDPDAHTGAAAVQIDQPLAPAPSEPTPFYKKAWFWSVVGVAVVGGVAGGLYAGGVFSKSSIPCSAPNGCY
jgi:tetratricopeptide (TPR) repeat protein